MARNSIFESKDNKVMLLCCNNDVDRTNRVFKRTANLIYNNLLFVRLSNTRKPAEHFNILDLSFY